MGPFRELCNRTGITQRELARRAGVHVRTIGRWTSGRHGTPLPWVIARVARALKVEYEQLHAILAAQTRLARRAAPDPGPDSERKD